MTKKKEFLLPDDIDTSVGKEPRDLVVVSQPKMGKSKILGHFTTKYNAVVLDLEKGGYEYVAARKISAYDTQETNDVEAFYNYITIRKNLVDHKGKYKVLIIDGLSDLDRMSELGGTLAYMDTVVGKKFNLVNPRDLTGPKYKPGDPKFRSVLTLPEGAGYWYTRKWFLDQIEFFREISPYRIYAAHVADKYIKEVGKDDVIGNEIYLTGKLKLIFSSKVTALCKLIADENKRFLNFEVLNDSIIAGSRAPYLKGKILISELDIETDEFITYWDNIYSKDF